MKRLLNTISATVVLEVCNMKKMLRCLSFLVALALILQLTPVLPISVRAEGESLSYITVDGWVVMSGKYMAFLFQFFISTLCRDKTDTKILCKTSYRRKHLVLFKFTAYYLIFYLRINLIIYRRATLIVNQYCHIITSHQLYILSIYSYFIKFCPFCQSRLTI